MNKIKVIVVDDSNFIRTLFSSMLSKAPDIEVAATAEDPYDAREKIKLHNPDVITLDVEMPKMDGLEFLEKIMKLRPMPVVMASTLTQRGADITFQALEMGAVDYIPKPTDAKQYENVAWLEQELIEKVRAAAGAKVKPRLDASEAKSGKAGSCKLRADAPELIAIGSSTGGVEAIREIITNLPIGLPPIIITQHMPEKFTTSFANRLNSLTELSVHEASDGMRIEANNIYIAPGNFHLKVARTAQGGLKTVVECTELVSGHRPSVDAMFTSVAEVVGNKAMGVILTGMGKDGAQGMKLMKSKGCYNVGESQESCVVYGMPKAAKEAGAIDTEVPLSKMAAFIVKHLEGK